MSPAAPFSIHVKRNCSISPRALGWIFAATVAVSFGIGVAFAYFGLWVVLPFAGIEMLALGAAFYLNCRHAGDYEHIKLDDEGLVLEIREGAQIERHRFNPQWVRLVVDGPRVSLAYAGREITLGRHLDAAGRARLASALKMRIAALR